MSDPAKAIALRLRRCCRGLADATLRRADSARWDSLLFDGGRHRIILQLDGPRTDAAIEAIRSAVSAEPFEIPGHLIAEIRLAGIERRTDPPMLTVEALTVRS
jgi:hypothetical protein